MSTATATRPYARSTSPAGPAGAPRRPQLSAVRPVSVARGRSRVHLTGRGRFLVLLTLVALLLGAFAFGRSASHAAVTAGSGAPTLTQVTVQPGDTLWSVSRRLAPHLDPRERRRPAAAPQPPAHERAAGRPAAAPAPRGLTDPITRCVCGRTGCGSGVWRAAAVAVWGGCCAWTGPG